MQAAKSQEAMTRIWGKVECIDALEKSNFHGVARTKIILLSLSLSFFLSFHEHQYVIFLGAAGVNDVGVKIPIILCIEGISKENITN